MSRKPRLEHRHTETEWTGEGGGERGRRLRAFYRSTSPVGAHLPQSNTSSGGWEGRGEGEGGGVKRAKREKEKKTAGVGE